MNRRAGLLVLFLTLTASAQDGPEVPCNGCDQVPQFSLPASGWWYNPDQSGVGFNLEFQGELLIGSYYGYGPDGSAQWYIFAGPVQRSSISGEPAITVSATLQEFSAGACIGCPYVEPSQGPESRLLTIEFRQAHHARFTIAGAPPQNMVPLLVGVLGFKHFSDIVDYTFPDLEGNWAFVLNNPNREGPWGTIGYSFFFTAPVEERTAEGIVRRVRWYIDEYAHEPEIYSRGYLKCERELNEALEYGMPTCILLLLAAYPDSTQGYKEFPVSMANIGAKRVFAIDPASGVTLEAIRVSHDLDYRP